ncbi:MAG: fabF [Oscillospiraceae bacterium]|nr:fabF [Oscillospiraceae bacterium]
MERRVVITGLGAVSPVGNTVQESWDSLKTGRSGIGMLTKFDATDFKVSVAAEVKGLDLSLYLEKPEIRKNDLYTQYAIVAAIQAVADSGIEGRIDPERFGVYVGSGIGGISTTIENEHKLLEGGPRKVSPFMVPMMISNMAAGVVSIKCNARGPVLPVVTACATSTTAIGEAYRAIRHGYADGIIAGGSEAATMPLAVAGFSSCMALSKNPDPVTACRPFDQNRDGFVIGEGGVVLIVEELEHAKARGAHIYCELKGYGNTSDAYHITAPDPEAGGISRAIRMAMEQAGALPEEGLYINAHGTSTHLNDKTESIAFKMALGEAAYRCPISSTKSMTGHMLGAAGAMEALVCAKALEDGIIPPTIGYSEPDPDCDLDYVPNQARIFDGKWALSTSLGFGGHNGALVFRKYEEA